MNFLDSVFGSECVVDLQDANQSGHDDDDADDDHGSQVGKNPTHALLFSLVPKGEFLFFVFSDRLLSEIVQVICQNSPHLTL